MAPPATSQLIERATARARTDPGFAEALSELVEAPSSDAGSYSQAAASALNQQRAAEARDRFTAGAVTTEEARRLLGLGTPQAVHRLRSRGRLIGAAIGNATWFPAWQFADGALRPDLPEVLAQLGAFTHDAIAADRIMRLERTELGGHSIAESLGTRRDVLARRLLAQLGG